MTLNALLSRLTARPLHAARMFQVLQDRITREIEAVDGVGVFEQDEWSRGELGGGGRSRVMSEGRIFEKAGVGFSAVRAEQLPPSVLKERPDAQGHPFVATGTSVVFHPLNPHVPTVHMNVRYFEAGPVWWFGGGIDLTPYYPERLDVIHFHRTLKAVCDRHNPAFYPRFKAWCDDYFFIKHRNEPRGVGGIFFDYLGESTGGWDTVCAFVTDVGAAFLEAYVPIVRRRHGTIFTEQQRRFQLIRRGRYVEFNLVYDRGTLFGLQTGGRIESILMSLPPLVRWDYDWHPAPGSAEERLWTEFLPPRDWASEPGDSTSPLPPHT